MKIVRVEMIGLKQNRTFQGKLFYINIIVMSSLFIVLFAEIPRPQLD